MYVYVCGRLLKVYVCMFYRCSACDGSCFSKRSWATGTYVCMYDMYVGNIVQLMYPVCMYVCILNDPERQVCMYVCMYVCMICLWVILCNSCTLYVCMYVCMYVACAGSPEEADDAVQAAGVHALPDRVPQCIQRHQILPRKTHEAFTYIHTYMWRTFSKYLECMYVCVVVLCNGLLRELCL